MYKEENKAKKFAIGLFIFCICIAALCFGVFGYILFINQGNSAVDKNIVTISKIIFLTGIFFLTLAFGHLMPTLFSNKNNEKAHDENEIFDEINMINKLEKYLPKGEKLLAGIHAISNETNIKNIFGKSAYAQDRLIPDEDGNIIIVTKKKYSTYDIYLGITDSSLIITECAQDSYLYKFDEADTNEADVQNIDTEILLADIGTCFSLKDIQNLEIKNGWMGSIKCYITMKNGSYFKLMLPKFGGLGGGMPNHTKYREIILAKIAASKTSL